MWVVFHSMRRERSLSPFGRRLFAPTGDFHKCKRRTEDKGKIYWELSHLNLGGRGGPFRNIYGLRGGKLQPRDDSKGKVEDDEIAQIRLQGRDSSNSNSK